MALRFDVILRKMMRRAPSRPKLAAVDGKLVDDAAPAKKPAAAAATPRKRRTA